MKRHLKIKLYRRGRTLFGWVEEQTHRSWEFAPGEARCFGVLDSVRHPSLTALCFVVRGSDREDDDRLFWKRFDSVQTAQNMAAKIKADIARYNALDDEPQQAQTFPPNVEEIL